MVATSITTCGFLSDLVHHIQELWHDGLKDEEDHRTVADMKRLKKYNEPLLALPYYYASRAQVVGRVAMEDTCNDHTMTMHERDERGWSIREGRICPFLERREAPTPRPRRQKKRKKRRGQNRVRPQYGRMHSSLSSIPEGDEEPSDSDDSSDELSIRELQTSPSIEISTDDDNSSNSSQDSSEELSTDDDNIVGEYGYSNELSMSNVQRSSSKEISTDDDDSSNASEDLVEELSADDDAEPSARDTSLFTNDISTGRPSKPTTDSQGEFITINKELSLSEKSTDEASMVISSRKQKKQSVLGGPILPLWNKKWIMSKPARS